MKKLLSTSPLALEKQVFEAIQWFVDLLVQLLKKMKVVSFIGWYILK
ncbi:hypothetical protein [Cyclobacterium plantarum]|uniref:Uncharacterized protein n=1 Tax=Cyclobacterium plantarum TaxID=2716263 RepID=A0ABX0H528_9BACT|nr:hypothetical protein [Cyclobacterium plantarum]NHE55562.1 hypothetical protein [Cyclobacterium plantarum]